MDYKPFHPKNAGLPLFNNASFKGVARNIGIRLHLHFFKDSGSVGADRFDAQREHLCNFGERLPLCNQLDHLKLPIGEKMMRLSKTSTSQAWARRGNSCS